MENGRTEVQGMVFRKKQKMLYQHLMAPEVNTEISVRQQGTLPVADVIWHQGTSCPVDSNRQGRAG